MWVFKAQCSSLGKEQVHSCWQKCFQVFLRQHEGLHALAEVLKTLQRYITLRRGCTRCANVTAQRLSSTDAMCSTHKHWCEDLLPHETTRAGSKILAFGLHRGHSKRKSAGSVRCWQNYTTQSRSWVACYKNSR